jgi:hypothetical protein
MSTGPETRLYAVIKKELPIEITRVESRATLGVPDCWLSIPIDQEDLKSFCIFATLELKTTSTRAVRLSPHQIAWHIRHKKSPSYILVSFLPKRFDLRQYFLYHASQILDLNLMGIDTPNPVFHSLHRKTDWNHFRIALIDSIYRW